MSDISDVMSFSPLWGEWHIKDLIGKGTFGAVYKAEKSEYGNTYTSAVKHISIPNDSINTEALISEGVVSDEKSLGAYYDALRDRMIKEINFCYELRGNTNIVAYEDHCIIPKKSGVGYDIFIRMEHLTPLTKYMRRKGFCQKDVIQIGIDICEALQVLDRHRMIHRDIKPANIFVNSVGVFKLGDFGESKILSENSVGMSVRGTYTYMSPEISMSKNADIRSDIYSLGIVLYRLLNGNRAPFVSTDAPSVNSQMVEEANVKRFRGDTLPLPKYCTDPALAAVVMKACEFSPERRWQTPREMKKALEALQDGKPTAGGAVGSLTDDTPQTSSQGVPENTGAAKKGRKGRVLLVSVIAALIIAAGTVTAVIVLNRGSGDSTVQTSGNNAAQNSQTLTSSPVSQPVSSPESSAPDASQQSSSASSVKENNIVSLSIKESPRKTDYIVGEEADFTGLVIEAVSEDGTTRQLTSGDCRQQGFDTSSAGKSTVTMTYMGKSVSFDITVSEAPTDDVLKGSCGENASFRLDKNGVLTVSGTGPMDDYSLNYAVTENNTVKLVCSHPWVEHVDEIKSVVIEDGITSVGSYAFYECSRLSTVSVPDSVAGYGESSFKNCGQLTSISFSVSLSTIGEDLFVGCSGLKSFEVAPDNKTFTSQNGVLYSKDMKTLVKCPEGMTGNYSVPDGVQTIEKWAFDNCSGLTKIGLPDTLTGIKEYAFAGCTGVKSITVPVSVETAGNGIFRNWTSGQEIRIPGRKEAPATWQRGWDTDCKASILWDA